MTRLLLLLAVLTVGCAKSSDQKQHEADECYLRYGTSKLQTCLMTEYDWPSADAHAAQVKRENAGVR